MTTAPLDVLRARCGAGPRGPLLGGLFGGLLGGLVVAFVVLAVYWPMLGNGFHSDDFALLVNNRDLGLGGFFRFLLAADYGGRDWVYWRPGWALVCYLVHALAGPEPRAFMAVALGMHVVVCLIVFGIALAALRATVPATAAALLFGLASAHAEAVVWISAATNVVPAAALLFVGAWLVWRFAELGGEWRLWSCCVLVTASLTFKEAAYGFPLVALAALGTNRRAWGRRGAMLGCVAVFVAGVVALHYACLSKTHGLVGSAADVLAVAVHHAAGFARHLVPVSIADGWVVAVLLVLFAVALALCSATARFFLLWTAAATFPYVVLTHGERFAYFFHGPLALFVVQVAVDVVRRWPHRLVLAAASLTIAAIGCSLAKDTRSVIESYRRGSAAAEHVFASLHERGLDRADTLLVDNIPPYLTNGFEQMLELRTGRHVEVTVLQLLPQPPFLIYVDERTGSLARDATMLHYDARSERYEATSFGEVVGSLLPVPLFAIASHYRLVADAAAATAELGRAGVDPAQEPLLYERPVPEPDAGAVGRILRIETDLRKMGVSLECSGHALLVIAFPVPGVRFADPGQILVDGQPAKVLSANLRFHAVIVPPGVHDVVLRPAFGS
ncbi:MAG TPA: hypothetical protein VFZ65_21575 [Planctomycetota bacterium]|nr:hypothetical protein [Planctomycetota bacterium]